MMCVRVMWAGYLSPASVSPYPKRDTLSLSLLFFFSLSPGEQNKITKLNGEYKKRRDIKKQV